MAGSLHGSARTTPRVRAELQTSQDTTSRLAQRYGLSRTTVAKWRARTTTTDAPMGPSSPHSTVLTRVEEARVIEFRRRPLLPLDDVLGCLRDSIPKLTRSSLHRCLERHGISRPPPPAFQRRCRRNLGRLRPKTRTRFPSGATSPRQLSATSTSTSASCASLRASSTCSWPSTGCPSSPTSSSATMPVR